MLTKVDVKKFNTLIEVNALLASGCADLNFLLSSIVESAARTCGADASTLLLVNKETRLPDVEVSAGNAGKRAEPRAVKAGEGIAAQAALQNKTIVSDGGRRDNSKRAAAAVPIQVKGECLGVMEFSGKQDAGQFTADDLAWLELFAVQAGIAVVNAGNIEHERDKITQLLSEGMKSKRAGTAGIVAESAVMREKLDIVEQVAKTDSSVLILGESGVGKELFAEQIHLKSGRGGKRFVKIDCAAGPEGFLERELFGHAKGTFPGAADRFGCFELADGGTVFFDEICELPLKLQEKLLKVIQERTFEKDGSGAGVSADVRILAATHRDIEKRVEKREFLNDLYHRLNVFPLVIPPLRQRPADIPALAGFFLRQFMKKTRKVFDGFSGEAMDAMRSYPWPGNVRELENCVERACVTGKGAKIEAGDLFLTPPVSYAARPDEKGNLKAAENIFRARYIKQVLEEHRWNQTETAKVLDIQRTYLSRLIKELEISNSKE